MSERSRDLVEGLLADAPNLDELTDRLATLERQRDVLLQACKEGSAGLGFAISAISQKVPEADWPESSPRKAKKAVDAAIAEVEEEQGGYCSND